MYKVFSKEVVNVDQSVFRQVGHCKEQVLAIPLVDLTFGIKGMPLTESDPVDSFQNTFLLTLDARDADMSSEAFSPGYIYEYSGNTYVELHHTIRMGIFNMEVFFLVLSSDCEFAYFDADNELVDSCSLRDLELAGQIIDLSY